MAAPTPRLRSWTTTSTRDALPRPRDEARRTARRAIAAVASRLPSSTTTMWSTKPGTERIVAAILSASLQAGMTTATTRPRNMVALLGDLAARFVGRACRRFGRGLAVVVRVRTVPLGRLARAARRLVLVFSRPARLIGRGRRAGASRRGRSRADRGQVDRQRRVVDDDLLVVLVAGLLQGQLHGRHARQIDGQR